MGGFSVPSYTETAGQLLWDWTLGTPSEATNASMAVGQAIDSWSSPFDAIYNLFGYVSPGQKNNLINSETSELTQAGMSQTQAGQQSQSDVTGALSAPGFDPSQATWLNDLLSGLGTGITWILAGAAIIAMIWILIEAGKIL